MFKRFGITQADYEILFQKQGNVCAICGGQMALGRWNGYFHIDHNHKTGIVRGLLCGNCNVGLGNFQDNPDFLRRAAAYLER